MSSVIPLWRRHWDDPVYALYMTDLPPAGEPEPDTRLVGWKSGGGLNEAEDPCGRPPMTAISSDKEVG